MDEETKQSKLSEQQIEKPATQTNLVLIKNGQLVFAGGVKVSVWRRVAEAILAMVDEVVIQ